MRTEELVRGLDAARARTLSLTAFDDVELTTQHSPLMSPLVWDLAHIGQQEELWLLRDGNDAVPGLLPPAIEQLYDAFEHPRAERVTLPLLRPVEARRFVAEIRGRVLDRLEQTADPFVALMVEQHEQQHVETMLATHQLRAGAPILGSGCVLPAGRSLPDEPVLVPGGPFVLGVDAATDAASLDNERPAHVVDLPSFRIARAPVTNAQWQHSVDDGGYRQQRWWSSRGWEHRLRAGLERPLNWSPDGSRRRFGVVEDIPPDEPVQHVCFFEAEAYAAWAGARLPTEQEWEKACTWDPRAAVRRRWPWGALPPGPGLANIGGAALRPLRWVRIPPARPRTASSR